MRDSGVHDVTRERPKRYTPPALTTLRRHSPGGGGGMSPFPEHRTRMSLQWRPMPRNTLFASRVPGLLGFAMEGV
eukprot:345463-Pyramimonas_sp.AAC.1